VPKVFKQFGEDRDTIVVAPSGRGTSTWYVGKGHVDVLEVWADVFDTFAIDRDHVYASGHSMGGWGSYLLTLLYPDRFAAAAPAAGPVTQGAWTGADFEGCDELEFDGNTPCYISANGSDPRAQHTRKLLDNSLHVPYAILHGTSDELVPYSGVFRQHERLLQLGYRHRMYTYPGYEHYSHPAADQWAEAASYLHSFTRPANPAHVVYKRDMPFEEATESVQSGGVDLDFDFDSAYWMSELTPGTDEPTAAFDGRSLAIVETPHLTAPDSGPPTAPGQTGPYVITGLQWLDDPTAAAPAASNAFDVTLTGAQRVRLDLARMSIATDEPVAGSVDTELPLTLRLEGGWQTVPEVAIDGATVTATLSDGVVTIEVPAGTHALTVTPADDPERTGTMLTFTEGSASSAQYSDTATLEARLTTVDGLPLTGRAVSFNLGSGSATAETDGNGVATVTIPVTDAPGETNATAGFEGDQALLPAVAGTGFTIAREDTLTRLRVEGKGSKRTLTATLVDADSGAGIAQRTITFTVDGETLGTATTGDDGEATFEVPTRYGGAKHHFTALFDGDAFYVASSG
jgi:pimeloyl-ACP methyl ester carboxylesterase